jgi:8-oxo-dGTP pyrophosphatase MutT (NUDIX family)
MWAGECPENSAILWQTPRFSPIYSAMASGMDIDRGRFTALDFGRRAERFALPLSAAAALAADTDGLRGDHDLNPDLAEWLGPPGGFRTAAVLVGVVDREPGATVILTLRSEHLPSHAGQVAFPGGGAEGTDASLVDTALREAHEEIGLAPDRVSPIGLLEPYRTRSGFRIVPVLALVSEDMALIPDESEVADVFEVPLAFLMTEANHQRHSRMWQGRERQFYAMPYEERYIWGATAGILRVMYERLYAE